MSSGISKMHIAVEMIDGTERNITVGNPSLVAYDRTRAKRQWPKASEAPSLWTTFISWHHMKAAGLYDGTADEFMDRDCIGCEPVDEDGESITDPEAEPDEADPTSRAPEPA